MHKKVASEHVSRGTHALQIFRRRPHKRMHFILSMNQGPENTSVPCSTVPCWTVQTNRHRFSFARGMEYDERLGTPPDNPRPGPPKCTNTSTRHLHCTNLRPLPTLLPSVSCNASACASAASGSPSADSSLSPLSSTKSRSRNEPDTSEVI